MNFFDLGRLLVTIYKPLDEQSTAGILKALKSNPNVLYPRNIV